MKTKVKNIIIVAGMLLFLGCSDSTPVSLIDNIKSYSSQEEVRKIVNVDKGGWKVIEDTKTSPNDKRPPYHLFVTSIEDYSNLGEAGEAQFFYFNNRLMKIVFYPKHPDKYISTLNQNNDLKLNENSEQEIDSYLIIRVARDYANRMYVSFIDQRLEKEFDNWIRKYS